MAGLLRLNAPLPTLAPNSPGSSLSASSAKSSTPSRQKSASRSVKRVTVLELERADDGDDEGQLAHYSTLMTLIRSLLYRIHHPVAALDKYNAFLTLPPKNPEEAPQVSQLPII